MSISEESSLGTLAENYENDTKLWMKTIISLRYNIPIHEIEKWTIGNIRRHFRAVIYENEKYKKEEDRQW